VLENMAELAESEHPDFWHKNLKTVPRFSPSFIDKFAADHLPIKATLVRGYKFFYEDYIHDVEGENRVFSFYFFI